MVIWTDKLYSSFGRRRLLALLVQLSALDIAIFAHATAPNHSVSWHFYSVELPLKESYLVHAFVISTS
jgi:hypothetical protein